MHRAQKTSTLVCRIVLSVLPLFLLFLVSRPAHADIAILMEEPYGTFGHMNPTGHAAVYLDHICTDTPTQLRPCGPNEAGSVISRYHRVGGYDWIAVPLIPYLYAVEHTSQIPPTATPDIEAQNRDAYRRRHLEELAPDGPDGATPNGDWTQVVGASYDRKIFGLDMLTTQEQDEAFMAIFNDRSNKGRFNLFYRNCADFSKTVINIYFPKAVHRNIFGDAGMMTPKAAAKSIVKYGRKHPELKTSAFVIPQLPGTIPRSRHVDGVTEAFIKSKKYVIPLSILAPEFTGGVALTYVTRDRFTFPKDAEPLSGAELVQAAKSGTVGTPIAEDKPKADAAPPADAAPTPAVPASPAVSTMPAAMPKSTP